MSKLTGSIVELSAFHGGTVGSQRCPGLRYKASWWGQKPRRGAARPLLGDIKEVH